MSVQSNSSDKPTVTVSSKPAACHVSLNGFNARTRAALEMLFSRQPGKRFLLADQNPGLCIFDYDRPDVTKLWDAHRQRFPDLPTLIVSYMPVLVHPVLMPEVATDTVSVIGKPINPEELMNRLQALAKVKPVKRTSVVATPDPRDAQMSASRKQYDAAGSGSAAEGIDSKLCDEQLYERDEGLNPLDNTLLAAAGIHFREEDYFLHRLRQAVGMAQAQRSATCLQDNNNHILLLAVPDKHGVSVVLPHSVDLRQLCLRSLQQGEITLQSFNRSVDVIKGQRLRADTFLWEVALRTSRGRVAAGMSLYEPVHLKYWPNFTRLMESPHAMQIAALLVQSALPLRDVAAHLDIDMGPVLSFYTAASVLGLIERPRRSESMEVTPEAVPAPAADKKKTVPPAASGLLSRLLKKLVVPRG